MQFLTREFFDLLIIAVIVVGGVMAAVRLYSDFTRPLPEDEIPEWAKDDTDPHKPEA